MTYVSAETVVSLVRTAEELHKEAPLCISVELGGNSTSGFVYEVTNTKDNASIRVPVDKGNEAVEDAIKKLLYDEPPKPDWRLIQAKNLLADVAALIGNKASVTLDTESNVRIAGAYDRKVKMPLMMASTDTLQAVVAWLDEDGFDPDTFNNPRYYLTRYEYDGFELEEK